MARKQQRAARFGVEPTVASYAPAKIPEDEVKKQQRAERFGVDYKPAEGLMDIGDLPPASPLSSHICMPCPYLRSFTLDIGPWLEKEDCAN